ncbi:MAG: hypothetical protein KDA98_14635 [Acidimicrobiales bacterium]|nr:hypothetical protein [Acidimicrobiales bacterium]
MSHPDGLPDLFLDRSLGRKKVPEGLRAAGLRLTTLAEHYGIPADADVADETWLEMAGCRRQLEALGLAVTSAAYHAVLVVALRRDGEEFRWKARTRIA